MVKKVTCLVNFLKHQNLKSAGLLLSIINGVLQRSQLKKTRKNLTMSLQKGQDYLNT